MATPRHNMDEMASDQASKYITFNDALRHMDGKVMPSVEDKDLTTSPSVSTADDGKVWIAAGVGGDWSGFSVNDMVQWYDDAWYNFVPDEGWGPVYVKDENTYYYFNGSNWVTLTSLLASDFLKQSKIELGGFVLRGNADPDIVNTISGLYAYGFDAAALEEVIFTVDLPENYPNDGNITISVKWSPIDNTTGSVVWALEYTWANVGATFPASTTITVTDTISSGDQDGNRKKSFAAITGTDKTAGSILQCRLYRDAADTSDDYAADAGLLSVEVDYS